MSAIHAVAAGAYPSSTGDTQTVTVGIAGSSPDRNVGYITGGTGSINDGTSNLYSGATILQLQWDEPGETVSFQVQGVRANSGWATMTVAGTAYSRTAATFSTAGGNSVWSFSAPSNPFGLTIGATKVVVFS